MTTPSPTESPFRILAKTYTNNLVSREQYVQVRARLLRKLESSGNVSEEDLKNFSKMTPEAEKSPVTQNQYSLSDWIIIGLGLLASIALAIILYG